MSPRSNYQTTERERVAHERQYRRSAAEIDLKRIEFNFKAFKNLAPVGTFICPMVKANGYGHGDVEVARALRNAGSGFVGVALIEEGERLRRSGDRDPILVFGPCDPSSAEAMLRENLTPVASGWDQLSALESAHSVLGLGRVGIHLEFNTGMNRLGFDPDDVARLNEWLSDQKDFRIEGICTHLFSGNDAGEAAGESNGQLEKLSVIADGFSAWPDLIVHALNSSASLNVWSRLQEKKEVPASARKTLGLRPGIGIYGPNPHNNEHAQMELKPAMTLRTHIASIHWVAKGESVSYGPIWRAERESIIATVPFGYADGYRRGLSNKASVLIRGQRVPQVGTVCMDYFMIDVTDVVGADVKIGEDVVLLGEQGSEKITADELADLCGTISYEIFTAISDRVARTYLR